MTQKVYFITNGEHTKIGIASDVERRLNNMQVSNPKEFELTTTLKPQNGGVKELEKYLHAYYQEYNVSGEWFDLSMKEISGFTLTKTVDVNDLEDIVKSRRANESVDEKKSLMFRLEQCV